MVILVRPRTRRPASMLAGGIFPARPMDVDEERPEVSFDSTTRNLYRLEAVVPFSFSSFTSSLAR